MTSSPLITVETVVQAPIQTVWKLWTDPSHITQWNSASDDWHTTRAEADLRVGGRFVSRMEARDGSAGFDFSGFYTVVEAPRTLTYEMDDGRTCTIEFTEADGGTHISETFMAETENPIEMQRAGWQAILDRFKTHAESHDQ